MLYDMHVDSGPHRFVKAFFANSFHYLFNGKISGFRVFPMKKSSGDPNFVGNFQLSFRSGGHCGFA